ncbi:hypothetical protein SSS_00554 [Sarcoptes scabiei]|uniref:Uncharacterized protein n=1 Tax=Sarcoptes scabiei TaxID=52283 RepID=A0A834RBX3_SARSC|nr:hypothetical protein SSS_00554 [Sarcoptes scabiei]
MSRCIRAKIPLPTRINWSQSDSTVATAMANRILLRRILVFYSTLLRFRFHIADLEASGRKRSALCNKISSFACTVLRKGLRGGGRTVSVSEVRAHYCFTTGAVRISFVSFFQNLSTLHFLRSYLSSKMSSSSTKMSMMFQEHQHRMCRKHRLLLTDYNSSVAHYVSMHKGENTIAYKNQLVPVRFNSGNSDGKSNSSS